MVALFNAIAKSKSEAEEAEAEAEVGGGGREKDRPKKNLKEIAKNNFFEMLNQGSSAVSKPVVQDNQSESKKWAVLDDAPFVPSNKSSFKVLWE